MPIANTWSTYDAKGQREDLQDQIYRITPEETPFFSMIGRGPAANATLIEWQTDELAAVNLSNARVSGADAQFQALAPTVRVGNHTQISDKAIILSDTVEVVNKAGRKSELAFEMAKKSKELKRDKESILLHPQGGEPGSTSTPRKLASLLAWLKTNVDHGTGAGADPVYTAGVPGAARVDGTQRDITETLVQNVIQKVWASGGEPTILMVGPVNKVNVSRHFVGIASRTVNIASGDHSATHAIAAIDVYASDFGVLRVIPNRYQRERDAWVLNPQWMDVSYLRPTRVNELAKTGDAHKRQMICEWTFRCKQEAALGLVADLNTAIIPVT